MNAKKRGAIGAWLILQTLLAQGQAPDADALERAQRDADNPMRLIIEAGKIKSRGKAEADAKADGKADAKPEDRSAAEKATARVAAAKAPAAESAHVPTPEETRAAALASVRGLAAASQAETSDAPPATASPATLSDAPATAHEMRPGKEAEAAKEAGNKAASLGATASPVPTATAIATRTTTTTTASASSMLGVSANTVPADPPLSSAPDSASSSFVAPQAPKSTPLSLAADAEASPSQAVTSQTVNASALNASAGATPLAPEPRPAIATPAAPQPEPARVALAVAPLVREAPPVALELVSATQPELPDRVRRRLRRDGEVLLVFKVNTDGTVADLNVQSSSDSALDEIAVAAVRQWRYKPIAEARTHRLQLVFRRE